MSKDKTRSVGVGWKEYKKSLPLTTKIRVKLLVIKTAIMRPYYKHVRCSHKTAVSRLGSTENICIDCGKNFESDTRVIS